VTSTTGTLEVFGTTTGGTGGTRLNGVVVNDGAMDLLKVDFGRFGSGPSPVQPGFVGVAADQLTSHTIVEGAFTVTLEGQGFWNTTSTRVDSIDPSVRDFFRDYYYNNSTANGEGVIFTIEGVVPNTDYDLTLWSYDADNASPTPTTWTAFGDTTGTSGEVVNVRSPFPVTLDTNNTTIRVRSSTNRLEIFGTTTGGTGGTRLNGFDLQTIEAGLSGDYNADGKVDAADYVVWRKNGGTPQGYTDWRTNFGRTSGSGAAGGSALSAVPEPASLILVTLVLGFSVPINRRWRQ
jgi:hypothetical protein